MIVLVCGGIDYNGSVDCLHLLNDDVGTIDILVHGGAHGADSAAGAWAIRNGIHSAVVRPLWDHYGKAAGHIRNSAMLLLRPEYCVAFPGGRGTQNMINQCRSHGITVWEPYKK